MKKTYPIFEYHLFGFVFLQSRVEISGEPTQYRWLGPLVRARIREYLHTNPPSEGSGGDAT